MSNQEHTQHKNRPKLITLLLSMLLVFSMIIPTVIAPLEVYAYDDNAGGSSGNNDNLENTTDGQGVSYSRTGYLVYIAGVDGTLKSPVTFVSGSNKGFESRHNSAYLYSRIGHQAPSGFFTGAPWGTVISNSKGNMRDVLVNFVQEKGEFVIRNYLGDDIAEMCAANKDQYYLMFETVSWHGRPGDGKIDTVATHWGYVEMWAAGQAYGAGKGYYPYNKIAQALHVEKEWPGLVENGIVPPTVFLPKNSNACLPLNTMQSAGYGIAAFRLDLIGNDNQTTCDEPKQPEPHEPPNESTGTFKIVKSYRIRNTDTNTLTDSGTFVKPDSSPNITIEDESEYKLIEWKTSTTYKPDISSTKWESQVPATHKQGGKSPTTIEMKTPETTLYVLLEKPENQPNTSLGKADFIMSQSTITRKIKLSYPDNNGLKIMKDTKFKWESPAHKYDCSHTYYDSCGDENSSCPGHTSKCTWGKFTDDKVKFSLKNSNKDNYPTILATKAGWEAVTTTGLSAYTKRYVTATRTYRTGSIFNLGNWDYSCVLLRGQDKLTVASWKNTDLGTSAANTDLASVSSEGFSIANNTSQNRKKTNYMDKFSALFADDSPDLNTTYSTTSGDGHGNNCGSNTKSYSLTSQTWDVNVLVETYSGDISQGTIDSTCDSTPTSYGAFTDISALSNKNMVRGLEVPSGANLSFRPYVQMNYDVQTATHEPYSSSTSNHKTAYVLGDIQRGMAPNDYAEVSWKSRNSDSPNLTLNSLQWSTHSSVVDYVRGMGLNLNEWTALPGGATLDLTIKDSDKQVVMATTYQCIVDGSGKTQIDNAGGSYTGLEESDATSAHEAYVDSVISALDALNVEQWVTTNIDTSKHVWDISGSSMVEWGENLKAAGHPDQTASTEYKYYFSADGGRPEAPASEGDLDVEEKGTTTKKYTFFTNTKGEIRYTVDDVNPNIGSETKGNLANDSIANQINQRTHVVDKLRAAVEQGTGVDTTGRSKTGTNWYNEAFDGITVYVQTTELSLGYIDPPARSTVLDVKLTQTQDNQSDMFNRNKYNMSQYRTKPYSDTYMENDVVGTFKGNEVYMKEMNMLFFSKKFLIPNATVDDLH